jgi:hypothetical protein
MDNDVYAGFGFVSQDNLTGGALERNCKPGMVRSADGQSWDFPDETRRIYYIHRHLRESREKGILIG